MERWLETDEYEEVRETLKALLHFNDLARSDMGSGFTVYLLLNSQAEMGIQLAVSGWRRQQRFPTTL